MRIASRIGALAALLVALSALIAHPSPRMPHAGTHLAEATIDGLTHPKTRGILPAAETERASLRAIDPVGPDPLWVRALLAQPFHPPPPRAAARRPSPAPTCTLAGDRGGPAHPPRAPPFA
ncbi:hypothetical protein LCM08_24205 [Salipiger pacificus]|nr:hypothetical protein [Alloyangia pacifica]MCA0948044.1 hypothetical protein [Alloyangia pacifica]